MKNGIEIRWHGRGGQGAKTAALLLADVIVNTPKSKEEIMEHLKGYEGDVYTVDGRKISVDALGKNFPNSPMLAAIVAVSKVMPRDKLLTEMRASYEHKFAKKPEVIDGNMKALEMAFDAVEALM